ncbi:MAG: YfbK domain-containing protein, partial [Segetibacter sp.]
MKTHYLFFTLLVCMLVVAFAYTNGFIVKGKVINEKGIAITGASVIIRGTNKGVSTNSDGNFTIEVPDMKTKLVISAIGYKSGEFKIKDKKEIDIVLKASGETLAEVLIPTRPSGNMLSLRATSSIGFTTPIIRRDEEARSSGSVSSDNKKNANNGYNREGYDKIIENDFLKVEDNPLSTFSIDVDAASYSNVRRMLNYGELPPAGAVRIEEMINYFTYKYPQPTHEDPFSINTEITKCPWNEEHRIVSIGLQGKQIPTESLPSSNLTFLIDVSGSMGEEDKLPLVKASLKLLTEQLRVQDKVSIVVYAGNAGLVLPPTAGTEKAIIIQAIEKLEAGGSTAGGEGIQLAYRTAAKNFLKEGNNRVILCTDGDCNVGVSSDDELETLIESERKRGIFLTVLGYGTGNYQDAKMQKLADKGNGNHAYIDNRNEAKKVLVNEFGGTLFTIAKDVKLQVEFNPAKVKGYRLIGYENRLLAKEDFNNDKKDAGELGSGHTVTALYELIPVNVQSEELN